MGQQLVGGCVVVMGLVAAAVGLVMASQYLHRSHRSYQRAATRSSAAAHGWSIWFLGGFSGVGLGIRSLIAVLAWLAWTLAGLGFIGLGARLFHRG